MKTLNSTYFSVTPMFKCMKYFASCISKLEDKDGLTEALKAATLNPCKYIYLLILRKNIFSEISRNE